MRKSHAQVVLHGSKEITSQGNVYKGVFLNLTSKLALESRLRTQKRKFKQLIRDPNTAIDSSTPTSTPNFKNHPLYYIHTVCPRIVLQ
jgi:hypothetical protein